MSSEERWHTWTVRANKFDLVKRYLDKEVPEVKDVFFPTVLKEKKVGNRYYKRRFPLYSGYLFLRYSDADSSVYYKIRSNEFISGYVGQINDAEVSVMKEKESWNMSDKVVELNDTVEVMVGPMKGFKGTVIAINGNKITIKVELFGRETDASFSTSDIEIIRK